MVCPEEPYEIININPESWGQHTIKKNTFKIYKSEVETPGLKVRISVVGLLEESWLAIN